MVPATAGVTRASAICIVTSPNITTKISLHHHNIRLAALQAPRGVEFLPILNTGTIITCCKCKKKAFFERLSFSKSARRDSNPRPSPWQGDTPPLSHSRIQYLIFHLLRTLINILRKARDGIRTRDPRLGKAILHH